MADESDEYDRINKFLAARGISGDVRFMTPSEFFLAFATVMMDCVERIEAKKDG